ncbi:hypothetical protein TWF481_002371 [Arthrobotrys musiformis]|uniref:Nucleoside phosphorylase domain-containing protein n=1 Tax=Arthrobotrys musiformis TaxID=47236 RepID=A0AAV9VUV8_9PEZI
MSNPRDYTVGWICSLKTEYIAARAFLDETHGLPEHVSVGDKNAYTLGRMGRHNVVIAVLPHGEYGISSAARVASDMQHSFPCVRIGLLVGIGGGAPTPNHDIRLGDVVVSTTKNEKSCVLQYDFGKRIQGRKFQLTGSLNKPPPLLRAAITQLQVKYEEDGHQIDDAIDKALKKKPRMEGYRRPNLYSDKLYRSDVVHPFDNEEACLETCGLSGLISRPPRDENEDDPMIHYGRIASSNSLMMDALERDQLAQDEDILCFEMEAAGLMNHFPCLVIRGIYNYSDSHKNKEWQGYAAMTAAAYAKDLLSQIPPTRVEAEKKIGEMVERIEEKVNIMSETIGDVASVQQDDQRRELLSWPKAPEFKEWLEGKEKSLFCPGIPGAGKTMIASIVAGHLKTLRDQDAAQNVQTGVAFVYCIYNEREKQDSDDLLASILVQLVLGRPDIPEPIQKLYKSHRQGKKPRLSLDQISEAITSITTSYSRVFIVVDALDECKDSSVRNSLLSKLSELQAISDVRLMVTFRPEAIQEDKIMTRLEIRAQKEHIEEYLQSQISRLPDIVMENHELQNKIKTHISDLTRGM